jgi:hypothetical protein
MNVAATADRLRTGDEIDAVVVPAAVTRIRSGLRGASDA